MQIPLIEKSQDCYYTSINLAAGNNCVGHPTFDMCQLLIILQIRVQLLMTLHYLHIQNNHLASLFQSTSLTIFYL